MYFMSAGTVRNAISSCRVLFLITLIHIFLGNVLVSHNPSVYVSVATKLPRFDFFLLFSFCYIILIFTLTVPKGLGKPTPSILRSVIGVGQEC